MTGQLLLSLRGEKSERVCVLAHAHDARRFVCIPFDRSIRGSMDLSYARNHIYERARARYGIAAAALTIRVAIINYATLKENELPRVTITMLNAPRLVYRWCCKINIPCRRDHLSKIDNWQIHSRVNPRVFNYPGLVGYLINMLYFCSFIFNHRLAILSRATWFHLNLCTNLR